MKYDKRKRKRRTRYVPYDYEQAYDKNARDLQESELERIIRAGAAKTVYATKEIRSGEQLEIEIYPEFTRREADRIPPGGRIKKENSAAQNNLNDRNSRKACERIINHNFGTNDIWMTLTYRDADLPQDFDRAQKNIQNYLRKVNYHRKKRGLPNAKYVYITEWLEADDANAGIRCHHHVVIDGAMSMDCLEELWQHGDRNETRRLSKDEYGLCGMANYITKQPRRKHIKKWCASKGLQQPEQSKNHYKFTRRNVQKMVRDYAEIPEQMKKWFSAEGYIFTDAQVRYNDVNAQFYIYARMRKQEKIRRYKP